MPILNFSGTKNKQEYSIWDLDARCLGYLDPYAYVPLFPDFIGIDFRKSRLGYLSAHEFMFGDFGFRFESLVSGFGGLPTTGVPFWESPS